MSALEDLNVKLVATFGLKGDDLKNARDALVAGPLPQYLRWLQNQLESHGGEYFADNRLTIADLKVFVVMRGLRARESFARMTGWSRKRDCCHRTGAICLVHRLSRY
jgi:glutathione S-transferase